MDLLLRNVDVVAVKKIDELAKTKKMSRNEFLKIHLEKFAQLDAFQEERNRLEDTMQMVAEILVDQQIAIKKMKALFVMVMDIDGEEMEQIVQEFILKRGDENED